TEFTGGSRTAYVLFTRVIRDVTRTRSYWIARRDVFTRVAVTLMRNTARYIAPVNVDWSTTRAREFFENRLSVPPEIVTRPRTAWEDSFSITPTPLSRKDPPS